MTTQTSQHSLPLLDPSLRRNLTASILTGQVSALIMAAVMVLVFTVFLGKPPYFPIQVIGSAVFGDAALVGFHAPAFLTGLLLHQAGPALLWSLVFALGINKVLHPWDNVLAVGVAVAVLSQVIDVEVVMPVVMNTLHGHDLWARHVPSIWSWAAHLVFGAGFLLFAPIRARLHGDLE